MHMKLNFVLLTFQMWECPLQQASREVEKYLVQFATKSFSTNLQWTGIIEFTREKKSTNVMCALNVSRRVIAWKYIDFFIVKTPDNDSILESGFFPYVWISESKEF